VTAAKTLQRASSLCLSASSFIALALIPRLALIATRLHAYQTSVRLGATRTPTGSFARPGRKRLEIMVGNWTKLRLLYSAPQAGRQLLVRCPDSSRWTRTSTQPGTLMVMAATVNVTKQAPKSPYDCPSLASSPHVSLPAALFDGRRKQIATSC